MGFGPFYGPLFASAQLGADFAPVAVVHVGVETVRQF
jgi:hypothetical protein